MSKFSEAIKAAKGEESPKQESKKAISKEVKKTTNVEIKKDRNLANQNEQMVGINIKVPKSHRQHWAIESKKADSNITADIVEALTKKYGMP